MKIGDLAKATATPVETIRFYEAQGLLPLPVRSESNYRIYTPEHLQRLLFVRHCRRLDMAFDEIRVLLKFQQAPTQNCDAVNVVLDSHIGHVAQRIKELRQLQVQLKQLRQQCLQPQDGADCGILSGLKQASTQNLLRASASKRHVHGAHKN